MITATINGKVYSMDESDFAKNSKIVHEKSKIIIINLFEKINCLYFLLF